MNVTSSYLASDVAAEVGSEKVLWAASPRSWDYARHKWKSAWIGIPFTAFSIFWTWGAGGGLSDGKSAPTFFLLWGVMFICIGLSVLLSPFFAAWKAGRVYYVVTDRRAIIFEKVWSLKIQSFDAAAFEGFERVSRGGNAGDIIFQRKIERRGRGTNVSEVGFLGVAEFRKAEEALRIMALKAKDA